MLNDQLYRCGFCRRFHPLRTCAAFLRLSAKDKGYRVKRLEYCLNCLAKSHRLTQCTSTRRCAICAANHHSILHGFKSTRKSGVMNTGRRPTMSASVTNSHCVRQPSPSSSSGSSSSLISAHASSISTNSHYSHQSNHSRQSHHSQQSHSSHHSSRHTQTPSSFGQIANNRTASNLLRAAIESLSSFQQLYYCGNRKKRGMSTKSTQ